MNIPLAFGDYKGRSGAANAMEMVNMMVEGDNEGGAAPYTLIGTPGCSEFADTGSEERGRGGAGFHFDGELYCVFGSSVYRVNVASGAVFDVGSIGTDKGPVQWMENPEQICFIDGEKGYVITKDGKSMAAITDEDFPEPLSCTFKDGYGVAVEKDSGRLSVSDINDFTSWDALSFATAEYEPDNLVGCIASPDSLLAFGVETIQSFYNSGDTTFPFDSRPGASVQIGCGATESIARGENLVFWLDNHGKVRMLSGYSQEVVSTDQIENRIAQFNSIYDAQGYCYSQDGHFFYVLCFPSAGVTLVYDQSTGQWHSRTSGDGAWRPAWIVQAGRTVFAGDRSNGKVYKLDPETYADGGEEIRWFFTAQNVNSNRHKISHELLELHIEAGAIEAIDDPRLWMQYSDDDGRTWSREKWRSMGRAGQFKKRIVFRNLGQSRSRVYRFGGSDAVKRQVISLRLEGKDLGY